MKPIKLFKPYVSLRSRWYVNRVLSGTQLAEGPVVKQFEKEFAQYFNLDVDKVVAVNSGTSALELAYDLAGIKKGDEVITPVLTCTATNLPLVRRGAKIKFADIKENLLMSPKDVSKKISKKTKAIVYVDFGGASETLDEIRKIANKYKIPLIQDSAQSFGPLFNPQGNYVCMSFQAIKALTCGDGGMLICNKKTDADKAKRLRWFGYDRDLKHKLGDTDLTEAGYKYHMNDVAASIGLGNIRSIDGILNESISNSLTYFKMAKKFDLKILCYPWLTILIHPKAMEIKKFLAGYGIETGQHHYRNDKYKVFGKRQKLPVMDKLEEQYLLLPMHYAVSPLEVEFICEKIASFLWNSE